MIGDWTADGDELRHALGRGLGGDVFQHDDELVPAEPRDGVAGADRALDALADDGEQRVARLVAEGVVDEVEVIDVEEQDGDRGVAPQVPRERVSEAVEQEGAVREAGERVVQRFALQEILRPPELRDVLDLRDETGVRRRPVHGYLGDGDAAPHGVAGGVDVAFLHLVERQPAGCELLEELAVARQIVRVRELGETVADDRRGPEPEDALEPAVEVEIAAFGVEDGHPDRGGPERRTEEVVAVAHGGILPGRRSALYGTTLCIGTLWGGLKTAWGPATSGG